MEVTGELQSISKDWQSGKFIISLEINEKISQEMVEEIQNCKLAINLKKWREKRSINANALLWHCLDEIAKAIGSDKWSVYLDMLKIHGKYTYIIVKPNMVEATKQQWRECEEVGEIMVNGTPAVQMLCYFGSSTYDTKEFSILLDDVIGEMKNLGLQTPTSKEMQRALEQWEKMKNG